MITSFQWVLYHGKGARGGEGVNLVEYPPTGAGGEVR